MQLLIPGSWVPEGVLEYQGQDEGHPQCLPLDNGLDGREDFNHGRHRKMDNENESECYKHLILR